MPTKRRFTRDAYRTTAASVERAGGDTSFAGRQVIKETKKLHPLVDPAGYGLIRKSWPRYEEHGDKWVLAAGVPMLVENLLDTTGSMGENVDIAFRALPQQYDLLANGELPVLGRYDTQILNAIFGDIVDNFVLARSQAEMDVRIAEQLTLLVPESDGGDRSEDPEYGLFGSAYLTDQFVHKYGLLSYHFMITDAPSHGGIDYRNLVRVFGDTVFEKVRDNGHQMTEKNMPATAEIVSDLKRRSHAFAIIVGSGATRYWTRFYGAEHVVQVGTTEYLPYVEAAVIGLTEGVLDLHSLPKYLKSVGCSAPVAREIQRQVAGIPLAAQASLPNFGKIPLRGAVFAKKHDLWPVADAAPVAEVAAEMETWL